MTIKNYWLKTALLNFLVVAMLGLFLRLFMVAPPVGLNYKNLLHAHSHVAILGWLFSAFFVALIQAWLPPDVRNKNIYRWQFWLLQLAVLGMLLSFPVQGYGLYSITFSTLHILFSYWFIYQFLADARRSVSPLQLQALSFRFIKAALFFLALSTVGPWSLGPIMATGGSGTPLYFNAIYFYLHFQYNGWLSFAALGLLFRLLENRKVGVGKQQEPWVFHLVFWSCLLGFLLSILWVKPPPLVYYLAGAAALAQIIALFLLAQVLYRHRVSVAALFPEWWSRFLFSLAMAALILKVGMQLASAVPSVADLAYAVRNFIIGYLHLVLIGFISLFLLAYFIRQGQLNASRKSSRWGLGIFIAGFFLSEGLLFMQGLFFWTGWGMIPEYFGLLFWVSTPMPLGLLLFIVGQREQTPAGENITVEQVKPARSLI